MIHMRISFQRPLSPTQTSLQPQPAILIRRGGPGGGGDGADADDGIDFEANWLGKTGDLSVVFTPDIARVGFAIKKDANGDMVPDLNSPIGKITVTAIVKPPEATANITIVPDDRVAISTPVKDLANGLITFDLRGKVASLDLNGDGLVVAKKIDDGTVVGTEKVVVIVPQTIGRPFPKEVDSGDPNKGIEVIAQNIAVNSTTSPALNGPEGQIIPKSNSQLRTYYQFWQTITVVDQFGITLDSLYQGTEVEERTPAVPIVLPINQKLSTNGTYLDPLGVSEPKRENGNPVMVNQDSQAAKDWAAQLGDENRPIRIQDGGGSANTDVIIAGHQLNPGIEGRTLLFTPGHPNLLRIQWGE